MITCTLFGLCSEIKVKIKQDKIQTQRTINNKTEDIKYKTFDSMNEIENLEKILNSHTSMYIKDLKQE